MAAWRRHVLVYVAGQWFCSAQCQHPNGCPDKRLGYCRALLWRTLNHVVRRDAVREGNGPAMISHWKMDLLDFYKFGHYKYTIIAHRLLTGGNFSKGLFWAFYHDMIFYPKNGDGVSCWLLRNNVRNSFFQILGSNSTMVRH